MSKPDYRKLQQEEADSTILAAGLTLGLSSFAGLSFLPLAVDEMVPAAGQGLLQFRPESKQGYV